MAKSIFRRFPSDDLETELPEWEAVNLDGQVLVRTMVLEAAWDIAEDFFEAAPPAGGPSIPVAQTVYRQRMA